MTRRLLTDFEIMILLAIMRVGDDAYGVTIAREIEQTAGRSVQLPAVYVALGLAFFWSAVRKRGPFDFIVALILGLILLGIV